QGDAANPQKGSDGDFDAGSRVRGFSGLRLISAPAEPSGPAAGHFAETLLDSIGGSDVVVIDAGPIGTDTVTERLIGDARIAAIVVTASATGSALNTVARALSAIGSDPRLAVVLSDDTVAAPSR